MATANYTTTQTLYVIAQRTARRLLATRASILNSLTVEGGSTGVTQAKAEFADMANNTQKDIMAKIPSLNATSASLSIAAQGNSVAIPAMLFRSRIYEIEYLNTNSYANMLPIRFIGSVDARSLDPGMRNGNYVSQIAQFVAFNDATSTLLFYPTLSIATTFTIRFQFMPTTPFVGADFDNAASTNYSVIPDDFDDLMPLALALNMAKVMGRDGDVAKMEAELEGTRENRYFGKMEQVRRAIADNPAETIRYRYTYSNVPTSALCDNPLAGQNFGSRPVYS